MIKLQERVVIIVNDIYSKKNNKELSALVMRFQLLIDSINLDDTLTKEEKEKRISLVEHERNAQSFLILDTNKHKACYCLSKLRNISLVVGKSTDSIGMIPHAVGV